MILITFFTITIIHSCSYEGIQTTYKEKAGERLLYYINKENLSKDILSIDGFRYYKINILLSGEVIKYKSFIMKYGYVKKDNKLFCKDGNSISFSLENKNVLLKYIYGDKNCKD